MCLRMRILRWFGSLRNRVKTRNNRGCTLLMIYFSKSASIKVNSTGGDAHPDTLKFSSLCRVIRWPLPPSGVYYPFPARRVETVIHRVIMLRSTASLGVDYLPEDLGRPAVDEEPDYLRFSPGQHRPPPGRIEFCRGLKVEEVAIGREPKTSLLQKLNPPGHRHS